MSGLSEVLRLFLEKSWALGVLLLVTSESAWLVSRHGHRMPAMLDEWALPAAFLGFALIMLSAVNATMAAIIAFFSARRWAAKEATEAVANLSTLNLEELHALAEALNDGVTRISFHHGSIFANIWRKGLLTLKR